jgi:hypothetical protein
MPYFIKERETEIEVSPCEIFISSARYDSGRTLPACRYHSQYAAAMKESEQACTTIIGSDLKFSSTTAVCCRNGSCDY